MIRVWSIIKNGSLHSTIKLCNYNAHICKLKCLSAYSLQLYLVLADLMQRYACCVALSAFERSFSQGRRHSKFCI